MWPTIKDRTTKIRVPEAGNPANPKGLWKWLPQKERALQNRQLLGFCGVPSLHFLRSRYQKGKPPGDALRELAVLIHVHFMKSLVRRASSLILGPKKRNCRRASSLILGPEKEDLPESQFAYPENKEGGPAGEPVRLYWRQRRRTCRRASQNGRRAAPPRKALGGLPETAEGPPHRANLLLSRSYILALVMGNCHFLVFGQTPACQTILSPFDKGGRGGRQRKPNFSSDHASPP